MITRADIVERVREWGLREDVVEKDYVLGWVLWGISAHSRLSTQWVFKGGTCLKKCYIETYRFSEDLDFTVLPGGPIGPDEIHPTLREVLTRVSEESGIDFSITEPRFRSRPSGTSTEGRVYYRGPRQAPGAASIKLDLSGDEPVVRPPVLRQIAHSYPDLLPGDARARCYSFEELFAEKIRAMGQRGRPRDLYDIVNLFRRQDLRLHGDLIRTVLEEKCRAKGISIPSAETVGAGPHIQELESEWANMLGHQLPALPPLSAFLAELPALFGWLDGSIESVVLPSLALEADESSDWSPPPTIATWRTGVPLEVVRFAATNHLCVDLTYHGTVRTIEPYSLRRTSAGAIVLHALRSDTHEHRSYRIDRITGVKATTRPFVPSWAIEFSSQGPLAALPTARRHALGRMSRSVAVRRQTRNTRRRRRK
jgi:predicted nucleotidyltransferase component of viral defense system